MQRKLLHNIPFDALKIGMEAEHTRVLHADDLYVFANSSGNLNPMHLPKEDGDGDGSPEALAPSMWIASLVSAVLGCDLPGPGTIYRSQSLRFVSQAQAGETLVVRVRLLEKGEGRLARFATTVTTQDGRPVLEGEAEVIAPARAVTFDPAEVPGLILQDHQHFDRLLEAAAPLRPMRTAVVAPEEADALAGPLLAAQHGLIEPVLVGDPDRIAAAAQAAGLDISGVEIAPAPDHKAAVERAVALVREGRAGALMKGHLHTDIFLGAILSRESGLRTDRRLSHVFVMDVPGLDHLLMVTDAAINIAPDLMIKADIIQNAIHLAHSLGLAEPRVGILSAVETVNPAIPSTLDAAILSKMADRGQITGGLVDGPLAMDNAVDLAAARTKGIKGLVAGHADILVAPNMEAGNMLAKELTFLAHAQSAGIVMGARCPVILTSRADDEKSRLASCAVAVLHAARSA
ncbi:bifunctional enoyl-CoA hydratase/phosphate acetyltransferase [Seohaeicola zhoushanensis]|uniref:Bifunctional enoyl-CoA hydratase/phosphate acetyltransferase n=1 Tax=Seohaeicola zhoushanensis TaxID=1569283 RepID=A0A8J3GUK5_9RHOB|nr:bifunctional enoyl-CoA hydratase/phosphate acetyltransferase [Seohaeicola zhoushanensis]GHF40136.1 bifunctional enoyl-CoA hydratase/phosphate acetyltransferase [Seohaeicola zhoushanensis]